MLKIDGFDGALIGISTVWQRVDDGSAKRVDTLIYDGDVIVTILMHQSGLSEEEAIEYISYNIEGAYVGENTPIIVWPCTMKTITDMADEQDE
jgi:hypothetical protein